VRSISEFKLPTDYRQGRLGGYVNRCRDEMDDHLGDPDAFDWAEEMRITVRVVVTPLRRPSGTCLVTVAVDGTQAHVLVSIMVRIEGRLMDVQPRRLHVRRGEGEDHDRHEDPSHVLQECRMGGRTGQRSEQSLPSETQHAEAGCTLSVYVRNRRPI
jgi:hypothetical protein